MREVFWGVASVVGGLAVGSWLDLAARQLVFLMALVVGVYLLVLVRRQGQVLAEQMTGVGIEDLLSREKSLSSEEAREWLDRFLVEQQDKK